MQFNFLICSERSGSNLLTRLLNAHPSVCGPSPAHFIRHLFEFRPAYQDLSLRQNRQNLLDDTEALFRTMTGVWRSSWSDMRITDLNFHQMADLLRHIYETEARANDKAILFIKENHAWKMIDLLKEIAPECKFVWLVRDPRDMALSWKKSAILRGGVLRAAGVWQQDQAETLRLEPQLVAEKRLLRVTYEALVQDSLMTLQDICRFLDISDHSSSMLNSYQSVNKQIASRATDWSNLSKPVMQNNFGKYRTGLSPDEIAYVEQKCAAEMQQLGYASETETEKDLQTLEQILQPLELYNKPAYKDVSAEEKDLRLRRKQVIDNMKRRLTEAEAAI